MTRALAPGPAPSPSDGGARPASPAALAEGAEPLRAGLDVTVVTTADGFDALRPAWDDCAARATSASIFASFDWQRCWWRHYGAGRPLRIVVARRDGAVAGILPLYVAEAPVLPGLRARVLRLVGSGGDTSPDYLGPVVGADGEAATLGALCEAAVSSAGWDVLDLSDVAATSPFLPQLERACLRAGIATHRTPEATILVARLSATWPEFVAALPRDSRTKYARRPRKQCEEAGGRFFTWAGDPPLDALVDRIAELHRLRWQGRAESYAFSSPEYVAFHRDVMHALAARGQLRLYCLAMGDVVVGVYYCYAFRGEVAHFQVGFDPRYQPLAPGHALMSYAVEQAIGEGARVFDMLKGEYPHKKAWANERRATTGLRGYRRSPRGLLLRLRRAAGATVRGRTPAR